MYKLRLMACSIVFGVGIFLNSSLEAAVDNNDLSRTLRVTAQVVHDIVLPASILAANPNLTPVITVLKTLYKKYGGFGLCALLQQTNPGGEQGYLAVADLIQALPVGKLDDLLKENFDDGATLVHYAAVNNQTKFLKAVADKLNSTQRRRAFADEDIYGNSPLHYAALGTTDAWGTMQVLLLNEGEAAKMSKNNNCGMTPIHCAVLATSANIAIPVEANIRTVCSDGGAPVLGDWSSTMGNTPNSHPAHYGLSKTLTIPLAVSNIKTNANTVSDTPSLVVNVVENPEKTRLIGLKIGAEFYHQNIALPATVSANTSVTSTRTYGTSPDNTSLNIEIPVAVTVHATAARIHISISSPSEHFYGPIALRDILDGYVARNSASTTSKMAAIRSLTKLFGQADAFGYTPFFYSISGNSNLQWMLQNTFTHYFSQAGQMDQCVSLMKEAVTLWKDPLFYITPAQTGTSFGNNILRDMNRILFYAFPGLYASQFELIGHGGDFWNRY